MTSIEPIMYEGNQIIPLQFLKAVLPASSLGPRTNGKTNIGCIFRGQDGKEKTYYLYNICDHQECYKEVGSQAVAYTTGVPAMIGAMMVLTGKWNQPGVHNMEEFDPDPFMDALNRWGLPWKEDRDPVSGRLKCSALILPVSLHPTFWWMKQGCDATFRLKEVSDRTGCRILLAQKAFSMYSVYPIMREYLAGSTASGLYEARLGHEHFGGETHVFSPAYRKEEFEQILQFADHLVFNSPAQLRRYALRAKTAGKSVRSAHQSRTFHPGGSCHL